jgi:hypothetical protein
MTYEKVCTHIYKMHCQTFWKRCTSGNCDVLCTSMDIFLNHNHYFVTFTTVQTMKDNILNFTAETIPQTELL